MNFGSVEANGLHGQGYIVAACHSGGRGVIAAHPDPVRAVSRSMRVTLWVSSSRSIGSTDVIALSPFTVTSVVAVRFDRAVWPRYGQINRACGRDVQLAAKRLAAGRRPYSRCGYCRRGKFRRQP